MKYKVVFGIAFIICSYAFLLFSFRRFSKSFIRIDNHSKLEIKVKSQFNNSGALMIWSHDGGKYIITKCDDINDNSLNFFLNSGDSILKLSDNEELKIIRNNESFFFYLYK